MVLDLITYVRVCLFVIVSSNILSGTHVTVVPTYRNKLKLYTNSSIVPVDPNTSLNVIFGFNTL